MFMHIATNIRDMDKLKSHILNETDINITDYKIETYNLTEILIANTDLKTKLLGKLYQRLLKCRKMNILLVIFYDKKEDIEEVDYNRIITNNCFIIDSNI